MADVLLSIIDLKKDYVLKKKTIRALKKINLEIFEGEVFGLLGVNGAGKTTLSSIISTLHPPTYGDILYLGKSIYENINQFRRIIGFCPQKPNLNSLLTVEENLLFDARYFGIDAKTAKQKAKTLIEKYELSEYADLKPDVLSGGYKQRVMIARALMHDPKLVIFDEPTVGLDPHIRHQLWGSILELKKTNVSVILTTHYLDEAEVLSDRICILDKGLIKLTDTPSNLMKIYEKGKLEDVFLQLMSEESDNDEWIP